jgi:hypothetical protein
MAIYSTMEEIAAVGFFVLLLVQVVGIGIYVLLLGRLFSRLEAHHGPVYESLGSPSLILNSTTRNVLLYLRWLWRREYSNLPDRETVRRAIVVRTLLVTLFVNFVILLTLFFVFNISLSGRGH